MKKDLIGLALISIIEVLLGEANISYYCDAS